MGSRIWYTSSSYSSPRTRSDVTCIAWNHPHDPFMFATGSLHGSVQLWTRHEQQLLSPTLRSASPDDMRDSDIPLPQQEQEAGSGQRNDALRWRSLQFPIPIFGIYTVIVTSARLCRRCLCFAHSWHNLPILVHEHINLLVCDLSSALDEISEKEGSVGWSNESNLLKVGNELL